MTKKGLKFKQLTKSTWKDFETLFGERGACGGCWCMYMRQKRQEFKQLKGENNKKEMKKLVDKKTTIGLIAYIGKEPVGWCSVAPREDFVRFETSKVLKPVDDKPVWSIVCFFVDKKYRKQGLSVEIIKGAVEFCRKLSEASKIPGKSSSKEKKAGQPRRIIEGYPVVPYKENIPAAFAWNGLPNAFIKAGFKEVARRSKTRPIMRYYL